MINVLVFPCGSEIGLEINEALKRDKHIKLFGLSSVPCHGSFVYENYIEGVPFISDDSFIEEINKIIEENEIDVLIPAYDDVILILSENRERLSCKLATSPKETCQIARSKKKTYCRLQAYAFIPKLYDQNEISEADLPLFAKPDIGQGSQGAFLIEKLSDLARIDDYGVSYVICELLPGKEYTVDCFTDLHGEVISMSIRGRNRIRNGISVNTSSEKLPDEVREIGETINREMDFNGVWFYQVKLDSKGHFKLLEVAPRVAGSMSLSRVRGFNYILNMVYQVMGYEVKALPNQIDDVEEDRALSNIYKVNINYEIVYIDLDDTLVINGKVNTEAIAFLYQCQNYNKRIILISRHFREEQITLNEQHIATGIFDEIIHVNEQELKSSKIKERENAIFIDDAFRERLDVSKNCNIPVFDLDCIPALMD